MAKNLKGTCLCGAVSVEATLNEEAMGACHCNMCRRWSGGPMLTVDGGTDVTITGEDNISEFKSSEWAARGFCKHCGTHIFYKMNANGQYFMPAGLFDGVDSLLFSHQIFIDEKPGNYEFANETHNMTGAEVFAAFNGGDS